MSMTWTSKAMHILHIHISTGQMYNTENQDKSAISCKVSTTLLRSTAWPCWWCMLCYIKTNNTAAIYAAALLVWTRRLCPKLSRALAAAVCVLDAGRAVNWLLLATDWQQVHSTCITPSRAEQVLSHGHRILLPASAALLSVAQYKAQELEMSCYDSLMILARRMSRLI